MNGFSPSPIRLALMTAFLVLTAGCNQGPQTAEVEGTVTINGKPVTAGTVYMISADEQQSASAQLSPRGTYSTKSAPVGPVKVAIQTASFKGVYIPRPGGPPPPGGIGSMPRLPDDGKVGKVYVPVPDKYERPASSDLNFTIKPGTQTLDIPLSK